MVRDEGQQSEQEYRYGRIEHEAKAQDFKDRPVLDGALAKCHDDSGEAGERDSDLGDDREHIPCSVKTLPELPGMACRPFNASIWRALDLSPRVRRCSGFGPTNTRPFSRAMSAKSASSDISPYPG